MFKIKGRAHTDEQKEHITSRLLECWKENPHQRLGQLIINALNSETDSDLAFMLEDETLVEYIESFTKKKRMDRVLK